MIPRLGFAGASLIAVLTVSAPLAQAAIKCWENDEGIRECAQVVPPEHSHRRIEVINDRGVVVKVIEAAPTAEEIAERERREQQRKEEQRRLQEQRRKDEILLKSYTTEQDIIIARENNLQAVESIIDISKGALRTLREKLDFQQKRAADYERAGKEPPQELLNKMQDTREQIKDKQAYIEKKRAEKRRMKEKFGAQLERFRELKDNKSRADNASYPTGLLLLQHGTGQ